MKRAPLPIAAVLVTVACATPGPKTGTEVTRFHRGDTIAPQAVNVEAANTANEDSLEFSTYLGQVAAELNRLGFERVEGEQVDLLAIVDVTKSVEIQAPSRSPFSIGFGGSSYGGSGGMGVGASTDVGGSEGGEVIVTQLDVQLVSREQRDVLWEGRAVRTAESASGQQPVATVQKLSSALFLDFPGKSGSTIEVE
ncbi:MAG: DUF4136 domain-containing protein [Chromatiales bacterium]|nr:MAG: DUF4136 domain-containing protein [Chromatiales bacterium]